MNDRLCKVTGDTRVRSITRANVGPTLGRTRIDIEVDTNAHRSDIVGARRGASHGNGRVTICRGHLEHALKLSLKRLLEVSLDDPDYHDKVGKLMAWKLRVRIRD